MSELASTREIEVGAPAEQVWDAITDPAATPSYVFGCAIEGDWRPGGRWRYHSGGTAVIEGSVLEADPPRLLRLTASHVWDPECRDDPPFRITWQLDPAAGGRTRVRATHDGFPSESASYRHSADLEPILAGLRNVVDPDAMASIRRLDAIGGPEVGPLTPERVDDFLDFFDNRAFADNPSWAWCYCYNFRFAGTEAEGGRRTGEDNRRDMAAAIREGRAHGLLAYVDGRVVGWCSATPRAEMPRLVSRDFVPREGDRVGIIGCLVVAAPYRRHGVARQLVEAAGDYLAGLGCDVAEAYPLKELDLAVHGHYGPIEVYRDLGYETYRELPARLVVRRPLRPA
jgi:uncharacterized protein YndB with AHSA1/START domain/GNAT superfamily N-acetyltransferase